MPSNRVYYESILDGGDNHATNKRKKLHNDKTPPQERTQEHAQLDTGASMCLKLRSDTNLRHLQATIREKTSLAFQMIDQ
jgi:hypothetical protein